jgi:predicted RNA-binding Zn-ribbon protein involved in translation (DUF1610 family)
MCAWHLKWDGNTGVTGAADSHPDVTPFYCPICGVRAIGCCTSFRKSTGDSGYSSGCAIAGYSWQQKAPNDFEVPSIVSIGTHTHIYIYIYINI